MGGRVGGMLLSYLAGGRGDASWLVTPSEGGDKIAASTPHGGRKYKAILRTKYFVYVWMGGGGGVKENAARRPRRFNSSSP